MANPRVFVSSTCYDLSEVRDSLVEFIRSFGFEPVLSEHGDVFYHPDINTHDSCLNEVSNCELFILIIGGRFGGSYISDKSKSIVNAEYSAAKDSKIPVFTFVKRGVYSDHHFFTKNTENKHIAGMNFPSIDKNKDAEKIFAFINQVRGAPVNNGFFPFDFARDITDLLRKQWSGMFYEFLQQRNLVDQNKITTNLLTNISEAGEIVEELVKRLYRHVDKTGADEIFKEVEDHATARKFFELCTKMPVPFLDKSVKLSDFEYWYDYIAKASGARINTREGLYSSVDWGGVGAVFRWHDEHSETFREVEIDRKQKQRCFDVAKKLDQTNIETYIDEYFP